MKSLASYHLMLMLPGFIALSVSGLSLGKKGHYEQATFDLGARTGLNRRKVCQA